ncbi:hypothetical protein [Bacillus sp. T3]|uniref:lipopolysaccharide biosynthesis protein n=1 Tax=Bacillus sp. T3 TaxID=467262 RepID=UPI0029829E7F|nr:hypothetical protein [Bacillus sp. T3]
MDLVINLIATMLPILIVQFLLLPIVAREYDEYSYGLALTLISLITLSVQSFSVSLSNSRLLLNKTYVESNTAGDFNVLLIIFTILNIVFVSIGTYLYEGYLDILNLSSVLLISILQLVRRYLLVAFRIDINYKAILYSNIYLIVGYLLGMLLFLHTGLWQVIYLLGELISLTYILSKTNLIQEPIKITKFFKSTTSHGIITLVASFLGTLNTQVDRLILFPILGAKAVTVYYVSTLFGKTLSMGIVPMNNVVLTYLTKMEKFKIGYFKLLVITSTGLGILTYAFIIIISEPILNILYPSFATEAMELILITTLTAIINMICTVINPVIMRFCNISWQIWLNVINITIMVMLALSFINSYGIIGFCYATLIASIIKLILMIFIYYKNSSKINS